MRLTLVDCGCYILERQKRLLRLREEHSGGHCEVQRTVKTKKVTYNDLVYTSMYKEKTSRQTTSKATYLEKEAKNLIFWCNLYIKKSFEIGN